MKSYPQGGCTNYLGVHNSGEGLEEAILRDSANSYQALAGEKNLEGFLHVWTTFSSHKAKKVAQNRSNLAPNLTGFELFFWLYMS